MFGEVSFRFLAVRHDLFDEVSKNAIDTNKIDIIIGTNFIWVAPSRHEAFEGTYESICRHITSNL